MNTEAKTPRILIVDDERLNVDLLSAILSPEGEVVTAGDGKTALEITESEKLDLILLDVNMPEMDGYEICRQLKADSRTKDIPVVFVTAHSDAQDEINGIEIGAADYITKPINAYLVRARIRNLLALKRYQDELLAMAMMDGLTGIANRRRFDEHYDMEWRRQLRREGTMSIVLMDIDHFKPFNDNYGHQAGDDCLKEVARALAAELKRPADLVARYGGEEFVCVLPETDLEGAAAIAERFRQAVSDLGVPHAYSSATDHVTVSAGVTSAVVTEDLDPAALVKAADANLYTGKETGRNKVTASPFDPAAIAD